MDLHQICKGARCPAVECPTGDDGMTWEIEDLSGRTLLFAAPDTGAPVYFVAVPYGPRHAGVVETEDGAVALVQWVNGGEFPTSGIILG